MKSSSPAILAIWAIALLSAGLFCHQAQAQGPITGNITWTGTVTLNNPTNNPNGPSAADATQVTAWSGPSGMPQVASRDGSFAATVTVGDLTTFVAPWSFNTAVTITNFWSVDNFTFDLTVSSITSQGITAGGTRGQNGFVLVTGTGIAKASGFTNTPGTWRFSTQDPGAGTGPQFSFSAATSVPEGGTMVLLAMGCACLLGGKLLRRKH